MTSGPAAPPLRWAWVVVVLFTASGVRLQRPDGSLEGGFARSQLRDVLCLPTPGRPKPHWTVVFVLRPAAAAGYGAEDVVGGPVGEDPPVGREDDHAVDELVDRRTATTPTPRKDRR